MPSKDSHVIEFYGETCPHCISMKPVIAKIEASHNTTVKKLEVWNSPENQKIMEKYTDIISEACGGFAAVPAFVNTKTGQALCGAHDEADIIKLIDGEDCKDNVCMPHTKVKK
jgi:thiol-disulfide isomerase/thioredoxin